MSATKIDDKKILVTAALPYANGHIHIGHLVEYIQTDIWVRFQKLNGRRCIFICADDTHGTAIMIRARQEGRSEQELIAEMQAAHEKDFAGFGIDVIPVHRCGVTGFFVVRNVFVYMDDKLSILFAIKLNVATAAFSPAFLDVRYKLFDFRSRRNYVDCLSFSFNRT